MNKKKVVVASVTLLSCLGLWLYTTTPEVEAGGPCVVPESWGRVAGAFFQSGRRTPHVVFEAEDGTVRITDTKCNPEKDPTYTMLRSQD